MRQLLTLASLVLFGATACAHAPANYASTFQAGAWGYHHIARADKIGGAGTSTWEGYAWRASRALCDAERTRDLVAIQEATEKYEGKVTMTSTVGECVPVTVALGGSWWGFTLPSQPASGTATSTKAFCEGLRFKASHLMSACTPVTVTAQ